MNKFKKRYDLFGILFVFLVLFCFIISFRVDQINAYRYLLLAYVFLFCFAFCFFKVINEWLVVQEKLLLFGEPLSKEQFLFLKSFVLQPKLKIVRSFLMALSLFIQNEKEEAIIHIDHAQKKIRRLSNTSNNIRLQGRVNACCLLLHYLAKEEVLTVPIKEGYDKGDQLVIQFIQLLSVSKKNEISSEVLFELESLLEQEDAVFYRQYFILLLNQQRYVLQPQRAIEEIKQLYEVSKLENIKQQCAFYLEVWERKEEV